MNGDPRMLFRSGLLSNTGPPTAGAPPGQPDISYLLRQTPPQPPPYGHPGPPPGPAPFQPGQSNAAAHLASRMHSMGLSGGPGSNPVLSPGSGGGGRPTGHPLITPLHTGPTSRGIPSGPPHHSSPVPQHNNAQANSAQHQHLLAAVAAAAQQAQHATCGSNSGGNGLGPPLHTLSTQSASVVSSALNSPVVNRGIAATGHLPHGVNSASISACGNSAMDDVSLQDVLMSGQSYFYSPKNLERTRAAQKSQELCSPSWLLVPPRPDHELFLTRRSAETDKTLLTYTDPVLKNHLLNRVHSAMIQSDELLHSALPHLNGFEQVVPLENPNQLRKSVTLALPTLCFKAYSPKEQRVVLLRRLANARLHPGAFREPLDKLKAIVHGNLLPIRGAFETDAFGDHSVVMVSDFVPCVQTAQMLFMSDHMKLNGFNSPFNVEKAARPVSAIRGGRGAGLMREDDVWIFLLQLASAVRYAHLQLNRALRVLEPSKVLIQERQRVRINCFGAIDLLRFDPNNSSTSVSEDVDQCKAQDLVDLGRLLLCMSCGTTVAIQDGQLANSIDLLGRTYSKDLCSIISNLVNGAARSIIDIMPLIGTRFFDHLSRAWNYSEFLEEQLSKELENGRLFRLLVKLVTVCERSDPWGMESSDWANTGDRYMLKLFRDYLLHQSEPQTGAPWLDLQHVVSCLYKLEQGRPERLSLISRDGQNLILVTYLQVRTWLETSFQELEARMEGASQSVHQQQQQQQQLLLSVQQQQQHLGPDGMS